MGDGSMTICTKHPYMNNRNNHGGICPFCLQDKLGKLVSSSLPIAVFPSSSTPSSNSFRSEFTYAEINNGEGETKQRKPRSPFLLYYQKKQHSANERSNGKAVLHRSKSTLTPSRTFLDGCNNRGDEDRRRRFCSLWYHPRSSERNGSVSSLRRGNEGEMMEEEDNESGTMSLGRKVSRSRSVGCGSRSFSGDFFERITNGLGDCTLRQVGVAKGRRRE